MKIFLKKEDAIKMGYTHEGYYCRIPIYAKDLDSIIQIHEKCVLLAPLIAFLSAIESVLGGWTFHLREIDK